MQSEITEETKCRTDNEKTKEDISLAVSSISQPTVNIRTKKVFHHFVQSHKLTIDRTQNLLKEKAEFMENLNKKQAEIEQLQVELQKYTALNKQLEEETRIYNAQIANFKKNEQRDCTNLKEKCLLIDSLQSVNNNLQTDKNVLQAKNRELNLECERLSCAIKDLQKENIDLHTKYETLLTENKNFKTHSEHLQTNDSCEGSAGLRAVISQTKRENVKYDMIADFELSSDSDEDYLQCDKVSTMTKTEPWVCLRCKDLEMELSYEKANRTYGLLPRLLSPIPEELKTFCSVRVQTDPMPKVTDWKQNIENVPKLHASTQVNEFKSIDGFPINKINSFKILSEIKRNRDKILIEVANCGNKTTSDFSKLELVSSNEALPEVMKLMFSFLRTVTVSIQDAFEVITKQFNKIDMTSYIPQIGDHILNSTKNEQPDFNSTKANKKRSYREISDSDIKIDDEFTPNQKRKPKEQIKASQNGNGTQNSIKADEGNKTGINIENKTLTTMDGYMNNTKMSCPNSLINPSVRPLADDADALRMKRNLEIFAKAKLLKRNKNIIINAIPQTDNSHVRKSSLKTKVDIPKNTKTTTKKVSKRTTRNDLFDSSDSDDNAQTKKIKCKNGKRNHNFGQNQNLPSNSVEIPLNLDHSKNHIETNIAECSTLNNTNNLQSSIKASPVQDEENYNNTIEEISTSSKLFNESCDSENMESNNKILINETVLSPMNNLVSPSESTNDLFNLPSSSAEILVDDSKNHFETNAAECSKVNNTNNLPSSDLMTESSIRDNSEDSSDTTDEMYTSPKLIIKSHNDENIKTNNKIAINEPVPSPMNNLVSLSESSNNKVEGERNGLDYIEEHGENIKQNMTGLNFYQDNTQKIDSNDLVDIIAQENSANSSINSENIVENKKVFNFYEEHQHLSTQKDFINETLFSTNSNENHLKTNGTEICQSKPQILNVEAAAASCSKGNAFSTELIKNYDKTSTIIRSANSNLRSIMMEQMIDHQDVEIQYSYESSDKPINVLSGLLNQYVLVNRWKELTSQFRNVPPEGGKKFSKKIKLVKEILLPFIKEIDMIPSLPVAIEKLQDLNMPDLSIIVLECLLYNMSTEWAQISKTNKNPAGKLVELLYHLNKIFTGFLDYTINAISYKIFRLKQDKDKDDFTLLYSQIYIGLCMKCQKYSTLQMFLVDCFYCLSYKCITIMQQMLAVCPTILQIYDPNIEENILHTTMKCLIWELKSKGEKLSTSVILTKVRQTIFFRYKIPEDSRTMDGLLAKILHKATSSPDIEVYLSAILLARRESPAWVLNKLINQGFLALLQSSWNDYVDSTLKDISEESNKSDCGKQISLTPKLETVKMCLDVLGAVGRPLDEANKDKVISIIFLMKTMLASKVLDSIPELQEAIISALIQLSRHQYDAVADAIMLWKPSFLPSTRLLNKLKRFMHRKPFRFWLNKLNNEYVLLT